MTEIITIHGGLTSAPELRFSSAGVAIASGTIASTERYKDRDGTWQDGKSLYVRWSAFKEFAENIAASGLDKGSQVVITGKLHTRAFEDGNGQKRSSIELDVTDFAVSLKRATAQVTRAASTGQAPPPASTAGDSWTTPAAPDPFGDESPVPF